MLRTPSGRPVRGGGDLSTPRCPRVVDGPPSPGACRVSRPGGGGCSTGSRRWPV